MAYFYDEKGDNKRAEPLYIESLEMRKRLYKSDHPDLANSYNNLALVYNESGDYKKWYLEIRHG